MKASSDSVTTGYLGFGCPLSPCEKNQGYQVMLFQMGLEAGSLFHEAAGGDVSCLDGFVFG